MELIQQYQLYLFHQRKSNETIRSYLNTCKQFIAFLKHEFGISTFQKVDKTVSCKYLQHLKEVKQNTGATINVKIYALRSFFAYLVQEKHVSTNYLYRCCDPSTCKEHTLHTDVHWHTN